MRKESLAVVTLAVVLLLLAPHAVAERPEELDLIGEDPEGDADNYAITGFVALPETFSRGKQDILELWMATDDEHLHIELVLAAPYIGTSSLLFVVQFTVGDERYDVCWNVQSAGTTGDSVDVNENMDLACSRINDSTRVGPTTRSGGIEVSTNDAGQGVVYWPVPRSELGDPADGDEITEIVATTWNRGVNPSGAPSTAPQSQYLWSPADRAPDEDSWNYVFGGWQDALELNVTLVANATTAQIVPGGTATYLLQVTNGAADNVTLTVNTSAPQGLDVDFADNATLEMGGNETRDIELLVHADANLEQNTTHRFNLTLEHGNITVANLTLSVEVVSMDLAMDGAEPGEQNGATGNETALEDDETGLLVGPSPLLITLLALTYAALKRKRKAART